MRSLRFGLLPVVLAATLAPAQPPEKLAAVYRAGRTVAVASQANLLKPDARSRFGRAVSALGVEIKVVQGFATAPAERDILTAYRLAARKLEKAAANFELWAAMDEKTDQVDALMGAVPATRGGEQAKTEILDTLNRQGQQAMTEARLALATATTALREGRENLVKAERAYLNAKPEPPAPETPSRGPARGHPPGF